MQVLAVAEGGHLEQHVPDRVGHHDHAPAPGVFGSHVVRTAPRSRVFSILGPSTTVQSYHHQAVTTCPGFAPSAWADDGTLEALEDSRARFRIGVQWHPEAEHDNRMVGALVHAARDDLG
jgi:putative glutamine amidotransferase